MASSDLAAWRALVDKELAGAPFEKLVQTTAEGIALQPLYTERAVDPGVPGAAPFVRGGLADAPPVQLCMRAAAATLADDLEGGADALWIDLDDGDALAAAIAHGRDALAEARSAPSAAALAGLDARVVIATDPIARAARGELAVDRVAVELAALAELAPSGRRIARVSGVPFHDAGADAADELALVLSAGVAVLRACEARGCDAAAANALLTIQLAVGRDTFGELCKLRALRACWHRVLAAAGAPAAPPPPIHAVCSARALTQRDPWVNLLRVTTQLFAAILGGAAWITPSAFDDALGGDAPLGRRIARNTALVLRDESHLGRVLDAAGGSYYIEARTDALARAAWSRFQHVERDGGVVALLASGQLRARLDAAWAARAAAIAKRKESVLGVSEFADLDEKPAHAATSPPPASGALPRHRDAEGFEALRARVEAAPPRDVALIALGPPAEYRARTGYATALFATAGIRVREATAPVAADVACICGSDERYAAEAVATARALRAAGTSRILLAGRPGALEAPLREAGVTAFVFVGCDALATLAECLP